MQEYNLNSNFPQSQINDFHCLYYKRINARVILDGNQIEMALYVPVRTLGIYAKHVILRILYELRNLFVC